MVLKQESHFVQKLISSGMVTSLVIAIIASLIIQKTLAEKQV